MDKCGNAECRNYNSGVCEIHPRASKCVDWEDGGDPTQLLREKRAFVKQYVLNRSLGGGVGLVGGNAAEQGERAFNYIMNMHEETMR